MCDVRVDSSHTIHLLLVAVASEDRVHPKTARCIYSQALINGHLA